MATPDTPVSVLAAMITPAVLISSCGTLLLATSGRLGRAVDRVRGLSASFEELTADEDPDEHTRKRIELIFQQLDLLTSRARLLQRIQTLLYRAIGIFVATSITLGAVALVERLYAWIPVILGGIGACFLFYASMLMMIESRLALTSSYKEMDYLWEQGRNYAPADLLANYEAKKPFGI
ncbi:MAG TPA: DUF2721 domain-containing protein [Candidatus Obscuribacterales bacterium]